MLSVENTFKVNFIESLVTLKINISSDKGVLIKPMIIRGDSRTKGHCTEVTKFAAMQ